MIPYQFLSLEPNTPATGYWDHALIRDLLDNRTFRNYKGHDGSIVILPGAYQADRIVEINAYLNTLKWVVLIVTSDEENNFPVEEIKHPNIKIYVQYPKKGRHDKFGKFPLGYTLETRKHLSLVEKEFDFFFSGQMTHERRVACFEALKNKPNGMVFVSKGFATGMKPELYMKFMCKAKVCPAPAGPISADSFRTYEALEAGAIPIADNISIAGDKGYWQYLMDDPKFPTIKDYSDLPGYIDDQLDDFQNKANKIFAWWIKFKRDLQLQLIEDVADLTGKKHVQELTVIIPTSFIPSHPSTAIIDETIKSVRHHWPEAEIILTFDGLRKEHEEHADQYTEYIRNALFHCNTDWGNVVPLLFDKHLHQIGMAREAMKEVKTPLLLYVEHDAPLVTDMPIDWDRLVTAILDGESNLIRFHFESVIPEPHKGMMIGKPENQLLKTMQWSQRPHLTSTAFYKRILSENFSDKANCFIEDLVHSKLHEACLIDGILGWNQWRTHIYFPDGNIKRSYHTDGRAGGKKYDTNQIW